MNDTDQVPQSFNYGWIYHECVPSLNISESIVSFYSKRYRHTNQQGWRVRLIAGEIHKNGTKVFTDELLRVGDQLAWHRPPWQEPSVPASWQVVFDDDDLYVINKPSGLPVQPAGGFLEHTLLRLLERRFFGECVPKPVHRLGRFTSGLLVCARKPATRAWLSAQLRTSTRWACHGRSDTTSAVGSPFPDRPWEKTYLALLAPLRVPLSPGESLTITTPIVRRPHSRLGEIWCAGEDLQPHDQGGRPLPARSRITLLARHREADLVEVGIGTGRPHQIRIHCAALGAPLLGDPLYLPGGLALEERLPGEGGYQLHAYKLGLSLPGGENLHLCAPPPTGLATGL